MAELLTAVVEPHSQLAMRLLRLVTRYDTGDPSHQYVTAAVIVFLGGVDKVLSLAFELLYLAGQVEWKWMLRRKRENITPGEVVCDVGFARKLDRLKELGCDLTELEWLAELRNGYIHACTMNAGYTIRPDFRAKRLRLRPSGPTVHHSGAFLTRLRPKDVSAMSTALVGRLARFLVERGCENALRAVAERVAALPSDPQPWTQTLNAPGLSAEAIHEVVRQVNAHFVGDGCVKVIPVRSR